MAGAVGRAATALLRNAVGQAGVSASWTEAVNVSGPCSAGRAARWAPRQLALVEQLGGSSAVVAPLRVQRDVIGALTMVRVRDEHPFTKDDIPLIAERVRGIALGVDNARLHQSTHSKAEQLQRALLPELPQAGHLEPAARYLPSSTTAEVGGDWYDAFVLPGGDTALVIGDVSGHMDPDLPRTSAWDRLPADSTLLLFTDGLIERRGEALDDGMTRLRRHTARQARDPLDVFCDELIIAFGADSADDIALLALRPTPRPASPAEAARRSL